MRPERDDLFPAPRPGRATLTPPDAFAAPAPPPPAEPTAGTGATPLSASLLLDRVGRTTVTRQKLRDAIVALGRAVDAEILEREVARHALRLVAGHGASVGVPAPEGGFTFRTGYSRAGDAAVVPPIVAPAACEVVARSGRPLRDVLEHVGDDDRRSAWCVLAVPLRAGSHLLGVLVVWGSEADGHDAEDEDVLATLGAAAAPALAWLRREADGERERREIEALVDVARAAGESLRFGETMRMILRHARALTGADGALIALREGDYLHVRAVHGCVELLAGVHVPLHASLMGDAVRVGKPVIANAAHEDPRAHRLVRDLGVIDRALVAPLTTASGAIGALSVVNRHEPFVDADALVLQRLADLVAVAIVNARLFEAVEQATREWKAAVDAIATGFVVLDDEHRVVRANARAAELAGLGSPRELIGRRFEQCLLGTPDAAWHEPTVALALREGAPRRGTAQTADGRLMTVSAAPHPGGGTVVTVDLATG